MRHGSCPDPLGQKTVELIRVSVAIVLGTASGILLVTSALSPIGRDAVSPTTTKPAQQVTADAEGIPADGDRAPAHPSRGRPRPTLPQHRP